MKTICLKTENANSYTSIYLLDNNWNIDIKDSGTGLNNDTTNEKVFILDLNSNNACVFTFETEFPSDWESRKYNYVPDTDTWELISNPVELESGTVDTNGNSTS
jgi:hypothetical protein